MKGQYSKLIIIGNGFDLWQQLPTSYSCFKQFYKNNIGAIVDELGITASRNKDGDLITPVELIYSDIFRPSELSDDFFWNFEASTALIDDQNIIQYFGKSSKGLYKMQGTINDAQRILRKAFGDWIESIDIEPTVTNYNFGDDCYFINFNYTNTLEKRFGIDELNDYHIHGDAEDPESIIFGHATHPEMAFSELMKQHFVRTTSGRKSKRLRGLYLVEDALYETDKAVQDNIDELCWNMSLTGVHIEDITDIYVLGHSFSETDYEYIDFLVKATQAGVDYNTLSFLYKAQGLGIENMSEEEFLEWIQLNILYATQHRKLSMGKDNISFPVQESIERALFGKNDVITDGKGAVHEIGEEIEKAKDAVHKRFILEQAARTQEVIEELCIVKDVEELPADCLSILGAADYIDGGHGKRIEDAKWHISYYSESGRERIDSVMRRTGCNNYELIDGIDKCIEEFKNLK